MIAVGTDDLLESSLGFLARSIFWLGLVYSSMPFDSDSGQATGPAEAIGPITAPGLVAACAHGMSEDRRSAVGRHHCGLGWGRRGVPQGGDDIPSGGCAKVEGQGSTDA